MKTLDSSRPVFAALVAIALMTGMDSLIKAMSAHVETPQIVLLRYFFGVAVLMPFIVPHLRRGIPLHSLRAGALRGVTVFLTASLFFFALGRLPLAIAITISFTSPFWMVLLSRIILGEPMTRRALGAIALGLAGLITILGGLPGLSTGEPLDKLGVIAALMACISYALIFVLLRKQSAHDAVTVLLFVQTAAALLLSIPLGLAFWAPLEPEFWLVFIAIGVLGSAGHFFFTWAFAHAPASRIAPLDYSSFVWAVGIGIIVFGEVPGLNTYVGAGLIIAGCLIAIRRPPATQDPPATKETS